MKFSDLEDGSLFFCEGWLHRKISEDTAIAFRYLASHGVKPDVEVEEVKIEELDQFAKGF